jgi:hypothetical protein
MCGPHHTPWTMVWGVMLRTGVAKGQRYSAGRFATHCSAPGIRSAEEIVLGRWIVEANMAGVVVGRSLLL